MRQRLFAFTFVLVVAGLYLDNSRAVKPGGAPAPCVVGHTAAPIGFWTWPANSHVNIYLRQPDFSEAEVQPVRVAVENWDAAAAENGSHVHFTFRGLTPETKMSPGDMTIVRGNVYGKKLRHLALLEAHSLRNDQLIDYALIIVDFKVKNPEVLTNVMAHELGHSLGLLDCPQCNQKSTAMGLLNSGNDSNGIEGPTFCDKFEVVAAYRELKLHVRPAPTALALNKSLVDPGQEPEADDTPIVPKP